MPPAPEIRKEPRAVAVEFGGDAASEASDALGNPRLRIPLTRLDGADSECLFGAARTAGSVDGFRLFEVDQLLIGWSFEPVGGDMQGAARRLYGRLLAAASGRRLCRIWNYVPEINAVRGGIENYQAFNVGRSLAFQAAFGDKFPAVLPSASAVGSRGDALASLFVASTSNARHFENPEQVPAYRYPREYGPSPPSFSRATIASSGGRSLVFISGTAAIKDHATVAPGSLVAQVRCALDNLRLISRATGMGDDLGAGAGSERHFKVYLRNASDLPEAKARLAGALLRPGDRVVWLQADLCRAGLGIEIEATLLGAPPQ